MPLAAAQLGLSATARDAQRETGPGGAPLGRVSRVVRASPRPTRAGASVPLTVPTGALPGPPPRAVAAARAALRRRVVAGEPDDARGDHRRRAGAPVTSPQYVDQGQEYLL